MLDDPQPISGRWAELLATIDEASQRDRHRPDLPQLLDRVLRKVTDGFDPVWAAAAWLFDEEEDAWAIVSSIGLTPEAANVSFRSGTALPCQVGELGVPLLVNDLDAENFHRTCEEHYRMQAALYAPTRIGKRTTGVLALYSDRKDAFTKRDLELLSAVGEHLGIAVAFSMMNDRATQLAILEERDRQARDLHDGIHQVLSSLRIYTLEAEKALAGGDRADAESLLDELLRTIDEGTQELRESIALLRRHTAIYRDVYETAPRMRRRLEASGVTTELSVEPLPLPAAVSDAMAWICRESTTNVLKHSSAEHVRLAVRAEEDEAVLLVEDDGVGVPVDVDGSGQHIGLDVMRERANAIGGRLIVERRPTGGTRVECRVAISRRP